MASQETQIAVLETELKNVTKSIEDLTKVVSEMSTRLDNLRMAFPTRAEFEIIRIAVLGVANDGGLQKRVEELEKTKERQQGAWSTVQVFWTLIIGILSALGALGFYISIKR